MLRLSLITSMLLILIGGHTLAQNLTQSWAGSSALHNELTPHKELNRRHTGPNGKPCIALEASAKSEIVNKDIYEHWIKATNSCGQNIKLRVCYHGSDDCIAMNVPPWDSTNSVLGIYPMVKDFKYDAKEKF